MLGIFSLFSCKVKFDLSLNLQAHPVYASSEVSGESVHLRRLT